MADLKRWTSMIRTDKGVPLVKTLVDAGGGKQGAYQFRHLSFQEGLFAVDVVRGEGAGRRPAGGTPHAGRRVACSLIYFILLLGACHKRETAALYSTLNSVFGF